MKRTSAAAPLVAGVALLLVGGLIGLNPGVLDGALKGPIVVRLALAAAAGLVAVWYLLSAVSRLAGGSGGPDAGPTGRPFAEMVRGVRYVFLAVASVAVGSAFVVSHPLPLVIGLIVAAVDVIETSFLLIVGGRTGTDTER